MSQQPTFTLPDPTYDTHTWILQDEHNPAAHPPLIASASPTRQSNNDQQDGLPTTININGFNYQREVPNHNQGGNASPFGQTTQPNTVDDLRLWRSEWLPQVDKLKFMLEEFDPITVAPGDWTATLQKHDEEYRRVFAGVHRNAVGPSRLATSNFLDAYVELFGEQNRHQGMALLQGFPNRSLDRACALWDLSRIMRNNDSIRNLTNVKDLEPTTPEEHDFLNKFDEMLNFFGSTTNNGLQDLPNWREGSQIPLSIIRSYAAQDDSKSPRQASMKQRETRLSLEEAVRSPENQTSTSQDLVKLMEMAQELMPNLEDHNLLCDQQCVSSSRKRWLNIGAFMVSKHMLDNEVEVFFYTREELINALENTSLIPQEELSIRQNMLKAYRSMPPPLYLGEPPKNFQEITDIPSEGHSQSILKGIPASPGTHRGVARVFQSIDEAGSLQQGEILVVRALTPPWTPYVSVAGAIVTNSGGALSHGAVVAREFGIPAIVGTTNGTALIPDKSVISIDGNSGIIVIERS